MKVAHICVDDWANFMFQQHEALLSVGIGSVAYKIYRHTFNYPNQAEIVLPSDLKEKIKDCTHVIIYHSDINLLQFTTQGQKVCIYHTGTKFRTSYRHILAETLKYNHIIALPEFAMFIDCPYIVGAVKESNRFKEINTPYVIGHYPSNPSVKGSDLIVETFKDLKEFRYSFDRVSFEEQEQRVFETDIYIELFAPLQGVNVYGSFGMTALEAAAMGKIVVTQNTTGKDLYKKNYGECPLILVDTVQELRNSVINLIQKDVQEIKKLSSETRTWLESRHGYMATGARIHKSLREL